MCVCVRENKYENKYENKKKSIKKGVNANIWEPHISAILRREKRIRLNKNEAIIKKLYKTKCSIKMEEDIWRIIFPPYLTEIA